MLYTRKLEVEHKEVGGCTQGSWRLYTRKLSVDSSNCSLPQSVRYAGEELPWQLKSGVKMNGN